jgi:hypothetical protein
VLRKRKTDKNKVSLSHARSILQEKDVKEKLQACLVRGSGSGHDKMDVKIPKLLRVECKNTLKKSYKLNLEDLTKMYKSVKVDEVPFMQIDFIDDDSNTLGRFIVTGYEVLERYVEDHAR